MSLEKQEVRCEIRQQKGIFDMDYTANYQLPVWAETDRILRTDFNDAFGTIDTAMGGFGNCQIVYGTYTGTGQYSGSSSNTLTFNGQPLLVLVAHFYGEGNTFMVRDADRTYMYSKTVLQANMDRIILDWETPNAVSWWSYDAQQQLNIQGDPYYYVALIAADQ